MSPFTRVHRPSKTGVNTLNDALGTLHGCSAGHPNVSRRSAHPSIRGNAGFLYSSWSLRGNHRREVVPAVLLFSRYLQETAVIEVKGRTEGARGGALSPDHNGGYGGAAPVCTKKAPGGSPRRGSSAQVVTRASRNDVAVDADAQAVVVLILERVEGRRLGGVGKRGIGLHPARCRLQLLVDHVEALVEPRCEVVLGAGTDLPPVEVVVAGPLRHLEPRERDRTTDCARSGQVGAGEGGRGLRVADRQVGVVAVLDPQIRRIDRRLEVRKPQVVVGRVDAPGGGQLDLSGGVAEHAIGEEAVAEVLAVELHGAERTGRSEGRVPDGAQGVVDLELEVVAAVGIQLGAAAERPPHLVGR